MLNMLLYLMYSQFKGMNIVLPGAHWQLPIFFFFYLELNDTVSKTWLMMIGWCHALHHHHGLHVPMSLLYKAVNICGTFLLRQYLSLIVYILSLRPFDFVGHRLTWIFFYVFLGRKLTWRLLFFFTKWYSFIQIERLHHSTPLKT